MWFGGSMTDALAESGTQLPGRREPFRTSDAGQAPWKDLSGPFSGLGSHPAGLGAGPAEQALGPQLPIVVHLAKPQGAAIRVEDGHRAGGPESARHRLTVGQAPGLRVVDVDRMP